MHLRGVGVIQRTIGCFQGKMKDAARAAVKAVERKRPIVLLLPYITHTLSIRMTVNMRLDEYSRMTWSDILSTQAKVTYPRSQHEKTHGRLRIKRMVLTTHRYAVTLLTPHIG